MADYKNKMYIDTKPFKQVTQHIGQHVAVNEFGLVSHRLRDHRILRLPRLALCEPVTCRHERQCGWHLHPNRFCARHKQYGGNNYC